MPSLSLDCVNEPFVTCSELGQKETKGWSGNCGFPAVVLQGWSWWKPLPKIQGIRTSCTTQEINYCQVVGPTELLQILQNL